ncbi:MAG: hypothetical protein H5U37_07975 [Caldisericia bacterium]|nr:hypothetical protein [Caldisericia bacterium]
MNIENLLKEIEIEGEDELNKLKDNFEKEIYELKKEYEEKVSLLKKQWNEKIQKEISLYIEKKELDLKTRLDLLNLNWKNKILENFKNFSLEKFKNLDQETKRNFFKKEIIRNLETSDLEIHIDKKEKDLFDENFKNEIEKFVIEKFKKSNIKFIEDDETYIKGRGFILKISITDKFEEIFKENILEISKIIFEEHETNK